MSRRLIWVVAVVIVAGAAWWWSNQGPAPTDVNVVSVTRTETLRSYVTASGEIVATRYADVGSSVMGRLVDLRVSEGERVVAGQVLARIDPVQAESAVDSSAAALQALQAEATGAASQVRAAQADLVAAQSRQTETQRARDRAIELAAAGLLPQSELETATTAAETATAQVNAATAALARAEQAQQSATQRVAQGQAERRRVGDQLAKTEITAPLDGVVTRLDAQQGEMVVMGVQNQPGTILMTISDLSALNAEVKVAEADVLRLSNGDAAVAMLEALPGQEFDGQVVEIGASALPALNAQASAREFRVKVQLQGDVTSLRPGLTCDTEILVDERRDVLTAPLQAVVQRNGDSGVFVVADGVATFTPVTTGIIGGLTIEIAGVAEGTSIVSGPFQVLRDLVDGSAIRVGETTATS